MPAMLIFFLFAGMASDSWWSIKTSGIDSNLRGVSVIPRDDNADEATVWVSGSNGVILLSKNTGKSWTRIHVPKVDSLDFRGIKAFDEQTAYVMASGEGEKSGIYKTSDGGKTWALQYSDKRKSFFLDGLLCSDETHCFALSDPVDGKFLILATEDGQHWRELSPDKMPEALPNEGAFAASNSAFVMDGNNFYFGTGGPKARVFHSPDRGRTWSVSETPIISGSASTGIYSLSADELEVIAVGGDYKNPKLAEKNAAYSRDGGKTWRLAEMLPGGYRSAVANRNMSYVTVGPSGSEITDDGKKWRSIDSRPFNAVEVVKGQTWAVGPSGTIARFIDQTTLGI